MGVLDTVTLTDVCWLGASAEGTTPGMTLGEVLRPRLEALVYLILNHRAEGSSEHASDRREVSGRVLEPVKSATLLTCANF